MANKVKHYKASISALCCLIRWVPSQYLTLFAGKTPVMINYSTGASQNCLYAQKKCNIRTILTSEKLLEKIQEEPVKGMVFLEELVKINPLEKIKAAAISKLPTFVLKSIVSGGTEEDELVILFTSGSEKIQRQ